MSDVPEDWAALLGDYQARIQRAGRMGGEDKLARRAAAKLPNAREAIALLTDVDSFVELGRLVGSVEDIPCDALVGGLARINGRPVVVAVEDFTTKGGSIGHGANAKRVRLARLARQERLPYILLLDGAGARVTNSLERHPYAPSDLIELAQLPGLVPTVAVIFGSSAGHGALSGVMMDFVVMTRDASLFSAGPPLVAAALGEMVTKEQLGSAQMHVSVSGVAHNMVEDTAEACALVRRYLGHLPGNAWQHPPRASGDDQGPRRLDDILSVVPRDAQRPYDIRQVIRRLVDADSFLELQPMYGRSIVMGLAHLGGQSIGIVANQPAMYAGSITHDAALKAAHFVDLANSFHLPVLFLADNPGIMSGSKAEQAGTLRAAARLYTAQARLKSPKLHVTLRKAFGFGSSVMGMNPFDNQSITLAFPGVTLGGIPARGGDSAARVDAETAARLAEAEAQGSWTTADTMAFDDVIDPRELRNVLLQALQHSRARLELPVEPVTMPVLGP